MPELCWLVLNNYNKYLLTLFESAQKKYKTSVRYFLIFAASCLSACGVGNPSDYTHNGQTVTDYTSCALPPSQGAGSLKGSWASLPIHLVFDQDFYATNNGSAMIDLRAAVNTWNAWAALRGFQAFAIVNDGSSANSGLPIPAAAVSECSQSAYTASLTNAVGIWKIRSNGDGANGRVSCGTNRNLMATGVQGSTDWIISGGKITSASILLNFDGFNSPGKQHVDVQSLLLHELGHVLGLLHSCNGSTKTTVDQTTAPACSIAPSQFSNAVMFPILQPNQIRRTITQNDYSRVNCLY